MKKLILLGGLILSSASFASGGSAFNARCDIDSITIDPVAKGRVKIIYDNYGCEDDPAGHNAPSGVSCL